MSLSKSGYCSCAAFKAIRHGIFVKYFLKLIYWMGSTTYMHIWRGASFKNKWLRIEAKKNNSNVLKGEIPWRNDKGTIKSTWNISLIYSFSKRRAHCTSQSKKMHFEKTLSGNCQAYPPFSICTWNLSF